MALSKPLDTALEEELECGICLDKLKNPRLLTCHHSFCETCLDGCVHDSGTEGPTLVCPVCRYATVVPRTGVSGLRYDFRANKLLKVLEEEQKRKSKVGSGGSKCSLCDAAEAADFCVECDQNMCTVCSQFHKKMPVCRDHTLYPLHEVLSGNSRIAMTETNTSQCPKHDEQLKFYCKTCSTPICADCAVLDHNKADGHVCVYLKEVMPQLRRLLQRLVAQVSAKEGELKAFATDIDTTKQALTARCGIVNQRVTEEVAKIAVTLHEKSDLFKETALGSLHGIREENESNQKAVSNVLTVLNNVNSSKDDVEVAGVCASLRESAQSVVNRKLNREDYDSVQTAVETFDLRLVQDEACVHPNLRLVHTTASETLLEIPDDTEICSMSLNSENEIMVTQRYRDEKISYKRIQKCDQPQCNYFHEQEYRQKVLRARKGYNARKGGKMTKVLAERTIPPANVKEPKSVSYTFSKETQLMPRSRTVYRGKKAARPSQQTAMSLPELCSTLPNGQAVYVTEGLIYRDMNCVSSYRQNYYDIACDIYNTVYSVCEIESGQSEVYVIPPYNAPYSRPTGKIIPNRVAACGDSPESILVAQLQPATVSRISERGVIICSIKELDGSSWEKVAIASDASDNVYVLSSVNSMSTLRVFNEQGHRVETIFANRPNSSSNPAFNVESPGSRLSMAVTPDGSTIAAYIGGPNMLVITRDETDVKPQNKKIDRKVVEHNTV